MKISVDDKELFILSDIQKKVIMNDIPDEIFDLDMKRRLQHILMHKYEECFKRLKNEWEPILRDKGVEFIPTNLDKFAELVFSQPEYKSRSQREN